MDHVTNRFMYEYYAISGVRAQSQEYTCLALERFPKRKGRRQKSHNCRIGGKNDGHIYRKNSRSQWIGETTGVDKEWKNPS